MCADGYGASRFAAPDGTVAVSSGLRRDHAADARALEELERTPVHDRRVLLEGGTIVSMDPVLGNLVGDVLIRGTVIAQVGPDLAATAVGDDTIVVDATGTIVMPGLVDSHLHAWAGQMRGLAPAVDFQTYMALTHAGVAGHYRPHDMYVGNLVTSLQCLDAGVTTILDNSHNARTADHSSAAVEALFDAGIRAVHASGAPRAGDWDEQWPADVTRLRDEYFASEDQLVNLRLFDGFPVPEVWELARNEGLWVSTEMGNHVDNLADLHAKGLLTAEHTFNHCFRMSDDDWMLIRDTGVQVNVCPRSDASFGLGFGREPVRKALSLGIRPGLSMDNEISYGIDMFVEMQTLLLQQRAHTFESTFAEEPDVPDHLGLEEILEFATVRGAQNCNLGDKVGSLTAGKEADVVLVSTTDVSTFPLTNALATLVTFAGRGNVDTVLVGGEVRKWRGRLVGHDLAKVRRTVEASRDYLLSAQGLRPDVFAEHGSSPVND